MLIKIDSDVYSEILDDRFNSAQEWWGDEKTEALWPLFRDLICEVGIKPDKANPKYVVDNFVVNSEIISKDEFLDENYSSYYYNKYDGDWNALCEDAIVCDGNYAMMQISL